MNAPCRVRSALVVALLACAGLPGAVFADAPPPSTGVDSTVVPITPSRMIDTRPGASTVDGVQAGAGMVPAGSSIRVQVTGRGAIPADAVAVFANITITRPRSHGHATVYPCGDIPHTSTLNYTADKTVANATMTGLDASGGFCVASHAAAHVIVDVAAFVPDESQWRPLWPSRLYDSRPNGDTDDGTFRGQGPRPDGSVMVFGRGGVSGHEGEPIGAVALNVTAISTGDAGHVTLRPCGAESSTSTVNFGRSQVVANGLVVSPDIHGRICIDTVGWPNVIVDVVGVDPFTAPPVDIATLATLEPARLFDSRPGRQTVDGRQVGSGPTHAGGVARIPVAGRGGVPDGARAVLVNVTAVNAATDGHTTVFGCDGATPTASTSNVATGETVANTALVGLSPSGEICIATHMETDLVVDVLAVIAVAAPG